MVFASHSTSNTRGACMFEVLRASRMVLCAASIRLRSLVPCWMDLEALSADIAVDVCGEASAKSRARER